VPELPEVEVTRLGLIPRLPGQRINKILWSNKSLRLPIPRKLLTMHIQGTKIGSIDRRGKFLLFRMKNNSTMLIHLGMTGKLSLLPMDTPPVKHDHLRLILSGRKELRLNDARRFGCIIVWPPSHSEKLENEFSAGLGVEPLGDDFHPSYLQELSGHKKQPVKSFLMDSTHVAGIGNIYANEILFAAGVHPLTAVNLLDYSEWERITFFSRQILRQAIECGGSSISDFLGSSGNPGYFQLRFNVYNRRGENCRNCGTQIRKTVLAGRATYACPKCQVRKT
jgi:formamidopyrimidine-DNA glycosylase